MKAATWQRLAPLAAGVIAVSLLIQPATANTPAPAAAAQTSVRIGELDLPAGLPRLPSVGETMQRDLRSGLALNGIDPVSYRLGKPVAGRGEHELVIDGIVWRFASAANLAAFRDAPDIYAPAFGGYDPTGVAAGIAVDTDPALYAVVGSRLFLFRSRDNQQRFLQDQTLLSLAQEHWQAVSRMVVR